MRAVIPTELLLRLMNATPEQYAAVERILFNGECGMRNAEGTLHRAHLIRPADTFSPSDAEKESRFVFRRAGSHWDVVLDCRELFQLEDTLGARYIDYLLHHPGEVISAYDLEIVIQPEKAAARSRDSIQEKADPETVRNYLRELTRLRAEREQADERGDRAGTDRLDGEIEALEEALHGGGQVSDAGERARGNVSKAVAAVRRRLAKGSPAEKELADHIGHFVSLGYECLYRHAGGRKWEG